MTACPGRIDHATRVEDVTAAINALLAEGGIPALTFRAVADRVEMSPAALHFHFGDRERMLRIVAWHTGVARRRAIGGAARWDGVQAFLPAGGDDEGLVRTRAWLGWCELARSAAWLTPTMDEAADEELTLLRLVLENERGHALSSSELDWITVLVDGLTVAVCRPTRPMARDRARTELAGAVETLLAGAPQTRRT